MPRTAKKPSSEPEAGRLDEEYQAIQESLEDYLDAKLELLPKAEKGFAAQAGGFRWQRADTYFLVTLILLALLAWQLWVRTAPVPSQVLPVSQPASDVGSRPSTGGAPAMDEPLSSEDAASSGTVSAAGVDPDGAPPSATGSSP